MDWIENEMSTADFGDKRLTARSKKLLSRLLAQPGHSLPGACHGWDESQAAYRFFDHQNVTMENILSPHQAATQQRIADHETVLCIQDTSLLDYSKQTQTKGLGPLHYDEHRGLLLHPTLAVTPDRLCLGVLDSLIWARDDEHFRKRKERAQKPIEEKESIRWVGGYRQVCSVARQSANTQCVYIADRESDIYELFEEGVAQQHAADWLVRATQDRRLLEEQCLSEALTEAISLGDIQYDLPHSHQRKRKRVIQTLKAVRVMLRPPERRSGETLKPVEITVLMAQEKHPPKDEEPVTWVLLTNLEVTTAAQAIEKVQWYLCRWQIEIYFRVLKSGCKIEKLQLEHVDRLKPALALYMIVAWRVLYLTMLSRDDLSTLYRTLDYIVFCISS